MQQCLPLAVLKPWCNEFGMILCCCCNSAYRLRYWNLAASQSTNYTILEGVATVPTACGIETFLPPLSCGMFQLQQCLPLAVLKLLNSSLPSKSKPLVATVPTACGIETFLTALFIPRDVYGCNSAYRLRYWNKLKQTRKTLERQFVATVPTACGIETNRSYLALEQILFLYRVATVPTACGIETNFHSAKA